MLLPAPASVPSDALNAPSLVYITGDLFSAPPRSILVHACNTKGAWGSGIAAAFKKRYPRAFEVYKAYCKEHGAAALGTCLLIPDVDGRGHEIACLFTSKAYGKRKDGPDEILDATRSALSDLVDKNVEGKELHGCNSGRLWPMSDNLFYPASETAAYGWERGSRVRSFQAQGDMPESLL